MRPTLGKENLEGNCELKQGGEKRGREGAKGGYPPGLLGVDDYRKRLSVRALLRQQLADKEAMHILFTLYDPDRVPPDKVGGNAGHILIASNL